MIYISQSIDLLCYQCKHSARLSPMHVKKTELGFPAEMKNRYAKFFFATISLHFHIPFACKKCEDFQEISLKSLSQKIMRKFHEKNNAKIL